MSHFNNITSFQNLKDQYRTLAMANHPDRGGDTATMQEINAEYSRLYAIWVNRIEDASVRPTMTAEQSIRHFYTQNGWEGSNYDSSLSTKDIAALVREYCKQNWNQWRFSIRCHFASMCSEISVQLKGGPIASGLVGEQGTCCQEFGYQTRYRYRSERDERVAPEAEIVMQDVIAYLKSFNYDDSDGMIDYFDTNFYIHECIAGSMEWKHIQKQARITAPQPTPSEEQAAAPQLGEGVDIITYSDRALAVVGDTKPLRARLKELKGRFNPGLTVDGIRRAGWVFSARSYTADTLRQAIFA